MRFLMICMAMLVAATATVEAGPFRRYRPNRTYSVMQSPAPVEVQVQTKSPVSQTVSSVTASSVTASSVTASSVTEAKGEDDALAEVNSARAKRGLRPFQPDPLLNQAALACAKIRAANRIDGHLSNDFVHLPSGASATSAGCGALEPSWGWGTCCTFDNYTYAGAAWVMGFDGQRYMHLFVR
jgi:uncharacterized protein YkwD